MSVALRTSNAVYLAQPRLDDRVGLAVIRPDLGRKAEFAGGLPAKQKLVGAENSIRPVTRVVRTWLYAADSVRDF